MDAALYAEEEAPLSLTVCDNNRHPECQTISSHTLADHLKQDQEVMIIDARFDYEFEGGHILEAVNFHNPEEVEQTFFKDRELIETMMLKGTPIVFHCEFS